MKILIVDDDTMYQSLMATFLKESGHAIELASHGELALERLRAEKFDLIISDILMPVLDGYQLCIECKHDENLKDIPFIFSSGTYTDEKDASLAYKFGAAAFLQKPISKDDLNTRIGQVVDNIETDKLKTPQDPLEDEQNIYKLYSQRLVNKLEQKMLALDKEKMALEMEISEREKIENKLIKSRNFADSLFDTAPGIALILDTDGHIIRFNPYMEMISGYTLEEVKHKKWTDVFSPINGQEDVKYLFPVDTDKTSSFGNISSIVTKEGDRRDIVWFDNTLKDVDGRATGLIAVGQDITKQLKIQKELFSAKKVEAIGRFAGGVAHEFTSLLTVILGNISLMKSAADAGEADSKYLEEARQAALRARELTSRLMTFSKGRDPVKKTVNTAALVKNSFESVVCGITLDCEYHFSDRLRPVAVDEWLIKHAFHNIALNAYESMKGSGRIKIYCENSYMKDQNGITHGEGKYVKISIQDQGPGIAEKNLSKLFDPYYSTKTIGTNRGMGLGLAVVHSIIEKHNGIIEVESEPGTGTTFHIYLPASDEKATDEPESRPSEPEILPGNGEAILVMDDEEPIRSLFSNMLNQLNYKQTVVADGKEAITIYKEKMNTDDPFDAVILDLTNPFGMNGEEAVKKILDIHSEAKIILSAGYPNHPTVRNFKDYGFSGVLIKPFTRSDLSAILSPTLPPKKQ